MPCDFIMFLRDFSLIAQFGSNTETAQWRETHQLSGNIQTNCFPFFLCVLIDGKLFWFFPTKSKKEGPPMADIRRTVKTLQQLVCQLNDDDVS
jgi:hypothetical protein